MTVESLEGHHGVPVAVDVCVPCHLFWFDGHESLQLAPAGVLALFRLIGGHALTPAAPPAAKDRCPRCQSRLTMTHDRQRNTRFHYLRCPRGHGRLISFVQFLREKNFVRLMTAQQIEELRQAVRTVNCSNCGAPIDLATHTTCGHCRSPLSMLDLKQAGAVVAELQAAAAPKAIDPTLPIRLAEARRDVEAAFGEFERTPRWFADVSAGGPLGAGLSALAAWLRGAR